MDNRKIFFAAAIAALAATTWAGGHHAHEPFGHTKAPAHAEMRRGDFSPPGKHHHNAHGHDKCHERHGHNERHGDVNNVPAKIRAARIARLNHEADRERARRSPISCYSNVDARLASMEQISINICNSTVVINQ